MEPDPAGTDQNQGPRELYRQYLDVFGDEANAELYRLALAKNDRFSHSKTSPNKHYPDWRKSTVIYDDQFAEVRERLVEEVGARLPEVLESLQIRRFPLGSFEVQLTSHNDGEYYKWHTDNGTPETASRVITFVYYFHGTPKRFCGGELVIHAPDGRRLVVEPRNDSIVFFSSALKHEVKPVVCPTRQFGDGRFTLNGWVRKRVAPRRDDFFGYGIFAPYAPAVRRPAPRTAQPPLESIAGRGPAPDSVAAPTGLKSPGETKVNASDDTGAERGYRSTRSGTPDASSLAETVAKLESLLNVYGELYRCSEKAGTIDVLHGITRREFFEQYYCMNRPVLLKGLLQESRALKTWSPEFFARQFHSVPVQITTGRVNDPDYESNFHRTVETVTMGEFVDRLSKSPETNDFYLVARNYFFDNPAFHSLKDDLKPPPEIIDADDQRRGSMKLWFGPRGTVTPLHHDEHSILFVQVYGRKQFKLIPSFDLPKLYLRKKYYSAVDPEKIDAEEFPEFLSASVVDLVAEPGDILFLPVGWWHWVKALDVSISATFCSFHVKGHNTVWKTAELRCPHPIEAR